MPTKRKPRGPIAADPAVTLAAALERCRDDWQRTVIAEWGRRHPNGAAAPPGFAPIPCTCTKCQGPAVIFPGETIEYPENQGYCLCPRCSFAQFQQTQEAEA